MRNALELTRYHTYQKRLYPSRVSLETREDTSALGLVQTETYAPFGKGQGSLTCTNP